METEKHRESAATGGQTPAGNAAPAVNSGSETVYPNIKYRPRNVPFAILTWLVLYFAPGILIGQGTTPLAGLLWMCLGGLLVGAFVWHCFFPQRLVADRDAFRIERPDRRRRRVAVRIGYGKIHEARWRPAATSWRRLLGPLVFIEPPWPAQRGGDNKLIITHGGPEVILKEDEIGHLAEFVETLRGRNVMGLKRPESSAPPSFFQR